MFRVNVHGSTIPQFQALSSNIKKKSSETEFAAPLSRFKMRKEADYQNHCKRFKSYTTKKIFSKTAYPTENRVLLIKVHNQQKIECFWSKTIDAK